jgi:hypothetical protein
VLDGTDARPPKRGDGEADPGYLRFWIDLT